MDFFKGKGPFFRIKKSFLLATRIRKIVRSKVWTIKKNLNNAVKLSSRS